MKYMTDLLLRQHLKPYKFKEGSDLKVPMPPPKQVKKLEAMKRRGLTVSYPRAPWFNDNEDALKKEADEKRERMSTAQHSEFLQRLPVNRKAYMSDGKVRVEKQDLPITF